MRGSAAALFIAAMAAIASLPCCSGGGGGGGNAGGTSTVILGDASFGIPQNDGFTISVDEVRALTEDGDRVPLFGGNEEANGFELPFFGDEFRPKVLASGPIPLGVYVGLEVCFRNPAVENDGSLHPATPARGCFAVTFPQPIEVTVGSGHAIRVDFDLQASVAAVGGSSFAFTPIVNGYGFEDGETQPVQAFRARVRSFSDGYEWAACTLLHPDGFGGWTEAGDLTVRFRPETVFAFADGNPVRFDNYFPLSDLDGYVGREFHFTGFVYHDGSLGAVSAELDAIDRTGFENVAMEGIVASGEGDGFTFLLTRVLDDDGNLIPSDMRVVRAAFSSDDTPVFLQSTGEVASHEMLLPGTRTWFVGHFPTPPLRRAGDAPPSESGDDEGFDSMDMNPGWKTLRRRSRHTLDRLQGEPVEGLFIDPIDFERTGRPDFVVANARLTDQQVRGVVHAFDAHEGLVLAELTGLQGFELGGESSARFSFHVLHDASITVDGLVPIALGDLHRDDQFEFMGVPIVGGYGGPASAGLIDDGDASPTLPGHHHSPVFTCRELRVRGREFRGEVVTGVDGAGYSFDLTGDGSDFALPDPTTFRIVVPAYVFAQAESAAGFEAGLHRDEFFSRLPLATNVECRGFYDANAAIPTIVATWLEVETP